jgi:uncharacterized ion transporter superfamily protein YfcC
MFQLYPIYSVVFSYNILVYLRNNKKKVEKQQEKSGETTRKKWRNNKKKVEKQQKKSGEITRKKSYCLFLCSYKYGKKGYELEK